MRVLKCLCYVQALVPPARIVVTTAKTIEAHPSNRDIIFQGCTVLSTLARSDSFRHIVMANGGATTAFTVMAAFPADGPVIEVCLLMLVELCQLGNSQRRKLVDSGLLQSLAGLDKLLTAEPIALLAAKILQALAGMCMIA